jgi:alcohol dehydrogenase class IV
MTVPRFRHATPPYRTFCGPDALEALPRELARVGVSRVVLVHGQSMNRFPDPMDRLKDVLGSHLAGTFDKVQEHTPVPSVEAARDVLLEADADAVIAVGGGSPVVTARAATILLAEAGPARDLATHRDRTGRLISPRLEAPKLPQWVVPTTPNTAYAKAGTAIQDPDTGDRLAMYDPKTRAQGVFIDPDFASTAPIALVTASALTAFSMAVEGLQADVGDPLADALLSKALRDLAQWMPRAVADPGDVEPRVRLMVAALLAGQGSDYTGGGLAQALSHAAGPRSAAANGIVEAMLLPHAMKFSAPVTQRGLHAVAEALGSRVGTGDAAGAAIAAVLETLRPVGIPDRLRDVGVEPAALTDIVKHAVEDWALATVPRPIGRDELEDLLTDAW